MPTRTRSIVATPVADFVHAKTRGVIVLTTDSRARHEDTLGPSVAMISRTASQQQMMASRDQSTTNFAPPGRAISSSMMKQATSFETISPEPGPWSSAVGHASTGKSGRVIERLQQQIDQITREKQLLKLRHEEAEKAAEMLTTRLQYLQDRNSNYESSHEASARQLQRKERQVEELREEIRREKIKTQHAEEGMQAASASEDRYKQQAAEARAIAQHKEVEYNAIATCRDMEHDRYRNGLDRIRRNVEDLIRQRDEDLDKQKRLQVIAEQQRQTIEQLEELTRKLTTNFNIYRQQIDTAVADLQSSTAEHDRASRQRLEEMRQVTGNMRWLMNVECVINRKEDLPQPLGDIPLPMHDPEPPSPSIPEFKAIEGPRQSSPSRPTSMGRMLGIDFRRHRRKESKPDK